MMQELLHLELISRAVALGFSRGQMLPPKGLSAQEIPYSDLQGVLAVALGKAQLRVQ